MIFMTSGSSRQIDQCSGEGDQLVTERSQLKTCNTAHNKTTTRGNIMRKKTLAFNIGALAALTSSAVLAQGTSNFALEEVVVTAQKREQNLQDVPVSAQSFNAEDIRVMGADTVSELMFAAPSLNAGGLGGSQQQMGIRGIIDYSRNPGVDPRMGIYIDEVYQGQGYSADQPLLGLANVEILRGPQGTLFGKNTVSGAINLVTKKPTQEFEGEIALTYGNEGQKKTQLYVSGGLADDLAASLSVSYDERDGLYNNTALGEENGDYQRISSRAKLNWAASDALEFTLSADYTNRESTEPAGTPLALPRFEIQAGQGTEDEIEFWGLALKTTYEMANGHELVSITSYRDTEYVFAGDDDMLLPLFQQTFFDEFNTQFTQEFRIQSPSEGNFTWLAGLYYFDSERSTGRSSQIGEALFAAFGLGPAAPFAAGTAFAPSTIDNTSMAAFFHSDWVLSDRVTMTFGVRYNEDEKRADWEQINVNAVGGAVPALALFPGAAFGFFDKEFKGTHKEDSTSPTLALNYKFDNGALLYGRYSKAAKAGGFNADFVLRPDLTAFQHDQETVNSFEVGYKTTLAENTVRLNVAAFQMEFDDFQVMAFLPNPTSASGISPELVNAAEVTVQGLEVELTWVPIENLRLFANATLLDAQYDKFALADYDFGDKDFSGNPLPYAPDLKYFISAQYIAQMGAGNLIFDIDYTSVDEQFSNPEAIDLNRLPDYTLVNARIAYTPTQGNWELALWGRNLADEEYRKTNSNNFLGTPRTIWGDPRLYGLTFTYFLGQ